LSAVVVPSCFLPGSPFFMSSRDTILATVRKHLPQSSPLPDFDGPWIVYADPLAQFSSVLEMIGGRCLRVASEAEIAGELAAFPPFANANQTLSLVPAAVTGNVSIDQIDDPHDLSDIDFAILPGELAVAENGAVWVCDTHVKHRVIYFLCQHLALVVQARDLVHNLHEAYERLTVTASPFGAFIAGPSKTADIEQSLVIGAHGPRSMTVFIVG
jgi:L-lactate dehydrogenase complex protein LldG